MSEHTRPSGRRSGGARGLGLWGAVGLTIGALLSGVPAQAKNLKDANALRSEITELEQQARGLSIRFSTDAGGTDQIAEHRLVDAQVLYSLKDYTRAAILLFDYVSKYEHTRGYPEAMFYLADSLYKKRDFLSARKFFKKIVNDVKGPYYQESLQRLVELSLRIDDTSDITQYLNALASIPRDQLKPSVPYVWGKFHYYKGDLDQALGGFRSVREDNKYYFQSQYFVGAIQVRQKEYAEAVKTFEALLKRTPKADAEKHIRDLTYLALGRLLYEQGKIPEAIDMYQRISRQSKEFDTSLYEISWAYIKAEEYQKALRALELLVLAHPDSPFIPQVKVLQGNLLIRLKEWGPATDLFTKTREKFVPAQTRMRQIMDEHSDPNVFFDALLARNVEEMGVVIKLPPIAVQWVKEDPKVKRALSLVQDLREIEQSIQESEAIIERLEAAINSPAKIRVFPEFAAAKARALEVENRLLLARRAILEQELALVQPVATDAEKQQLAALAQKRGGLADELKELPTSAEGYETREKSKLDNLQTMEKELTKLAVLVDNMRAQMVAAEKFFADTRHAKDDAVRASFRKEVEDIRVMILGLQVEVDEIRKDIVQAKTMTGVGGAEEVAERGVKERYRDSLEEEHRLLASIRARLNGQAGGEFDDLAGLLRRSAEVDRVLSSFDQKLESGVEEKLTSIRAAINEEKSHLDSYVNESSAFKARTDVVAGNLTYQGFQEVAQRFYEIIVRADVGIIDVSWALKDSKSKQVSQLVQQQKMDLKVLDEEFKEVLKEE